MNILKDLLILNMLLPDPDVEKFCSYLYDYYGFEAYERPRGTREIEESFGYSQYSLLCIRIYH